jgi:hypothetical protein
VVAAVVAIAVLCATAGCVQAQQGPTPLATAATSQSPGPTAATSKPPPTLDATGDAASNLAYFTYVVRQLVRKNKNPNGRQIVDHLVAAGFEKKAMQVTADKTAVGLDVDGIEFSVLINKSCLIGQTGNVGMHTLATTMLGTGKCLVGKTRAIDW